MDVKECMEKGFLRRVEVDQELVRKELAAAKYDLGAARHDLKRGDAKWATVKSYYSIFHAARAVLYSLGYQEKAHFAISAVLRELEKQGKLEAKYTLDFEACMESREDADYRLEYSKERAEVNIGIADEFLSRMKKLVAELTMSEAAKHMDGPRAKSAEGWSRGRR